MSQTITAPTGCARHGQREHRGGWPCVTKLLPSPEVFVMGMVQSALFLFCFRFVFGGAIDTGASSYVAYLVPGYVATIVLFTGAGIAIAVAEDRAEGFTDRLLSLPIPRRAIVIGRAMADASTNVWAICITVAFGFLFGFRVEGSVAQGLGALGLCLLYGVVLMIVFIVIGLIAPNGRLVQGMAMIAFILVFFSSTYVPVDTMPGWLQPFATYQPVTPMVEAVRSMLVGSSNDVGWPSSGQPCSSRRLHTDRRPPLSTRLTGGVSRKAEAGDEELVDEATDAARVVDVDGVTRDRHEGQDDAHDPFGGPGDVEIGRAPHPRHERSRGTRARRAPCRAPSLAGRCRPWRQRRPAPPPSDEGGGRLAGARGRTALLRQPGPQCREHSRRGMGVGPELLVDPGQRRDNEGCLVREVLVQPSPREPGFVGDLDDGRPPDARPAQAPLGRIEQAVAARDGGTPTGSGSGRRRRSRDDEVVGVGRAGPGPVVDEPPRAQRVDLAVRVLEERVLDRRL